MVGLKDSQCSDLKKGKHNRKTKHYRTSNKQKCSQNEVVFTLNLKVLHLSQFLLFFLQNVRENVLYPPTVWHTLFFLTGVPFLRSIPLSQFLPHYGILSPLSLFE